MPLRESLGGVEAGISAFEAYAELGPADRGRAATGDLVLREPRASGRMRAHAAWAARAAATVRFASGTPQAGMWPIASPVAGSRTGSSGAWLRTRRSSTLSGRVPARRGSNTCGVRLWTSQFALQVSLLV